MVRIESLLSTSLICLTALTALAAIPETKVETVDVDRELQYYGNDNYYYGNDGGGGSGKGGGSSCPGKLTYFESEVLVTFDGFDQDMNDVTKINWDGLEQTFMESYNSLAYELCDEDFTRVVDASIGVNSDGEILIKRSGCEYALRYHVQGVCRGCNPNSATLFSPPGRGGGYYRQLISTDGLSVNEQSAIEMPMKNKQKRRREKEYKSNKSNKGSKGTKGKGGGSWNGKGSKGGGDGDDDDSGGPDIPCDCGSKHPQYRTPTEEEFRVAYDSGIRAFRESKPHRHGGVAVDYVAKVSEVEDVECSVVEEEFNALISVEFFGDRAVVTDEERAVLEENFVWVYNGLQADRCDSPLFRTATLAEIILVSDPDEPSAFLYVFFVTGTCRGVGCSATATLFSADDLFRKLSHHLGYEGSSGACQCPLYTMEFGAPTTSEFEVRYFQAVQCEREKGRLANIDASGEVTELGPDFTPFPTDFPVAPPSSVQPVSLPPFTLPPGETFAPTTAPAPSITIPPFTLPPGQSNVPSASPSLDPTQPDETRAPSMAPSEEPSLQPSVSEAPSDGDVSEAPSVSEQPSVSLQPSDSSDSEAPSVSEQPSVSDAPSNASDSEAPSVSEQPSVSEAPSPGSDSEAPSVSEQPSVSEAPSPGDLSDEPSESVQPSDSIVPSETPSVSDQPSASSVPSELPSLSDAPSVSEEPSGSGEPSVSNAPVA
ncbi:MAG: hypothetical protein SGILL_002974 [Bacillariaceae sp.]